MFLVSTFIFVDIVLVLHLLNALGKKLGPFTGQVHQRGSGVVPSMLFFEYVNQTKLLIVYV